MYACTFCDRVFDDKDQRTAHRIEVHSFQQGTAGRCFLCRLRLPSFFSFIDHMDETHPTETAQLVVPTTKDGRFETYGWQYEPVYVEDGKDQLCKLEALIELNEMKRNPKPPVEESDTDDFSDLEEDEEGSNEEAPVLGLLPSPAPTEGYLDEHEEEELKVVKVEPSEDDQPDIKPIIKKEHFQSYEEEWEQNRPEREANERRMKKRIRPEDAPATSKRSKGLTERDPNVPQSSSSSSQETPSVQPPPASIPPPSVPPKECAFKPSPPLPPVDPRNNQDLQRRMPNLTGLLNYQIPPNQMMQPLQQLQLQQMQQMSAPFGFPFPMGNPQSMVHQYSQMSRMPAMNPPFGMMPSPYEPSFPHVDTSFGSNWSTVGMTPSPTSSSIFDHAKKEEARRSTSRVSTPSSMRLVDDQKETTGYVVGNVQFPPNVTNQQMVEALMSTFTPSSAVPSTSTAFPFSSLPSQQPLNLQIPAETERTESMPQLSPIIDPVTLSPAEVENQLETKPRLWLPKPVIGIADLTEGIPITVDMLSQPSTSFQTELDQTVAQVATGADDLEEGEVRDEQLLQQAVGAIHYAGGRGNGFHSSIGVPTFLQPDAAACSADSDYWQCKRGNSCPRCGFSGSTRASRTAHYLKYHFPIYYDLYKARPALTPLDRWLSIQLGKDSDAPKDSRVCPHCPPNRSHPMEFRGRVKLLEHIRDCHAGKFYEFGGQYVRTFVSHDTQTTNTSVHHLLITASAGVAQ